MLAEQFKSNMKKKLIIGYFGDNKWAQNTLKKLIDDKSIKVAFVYSRSQKDKLLEKISKKNLIPFRNTKNINSNKDIKYILKSKPDLLVSMSYDQIFKKKILSHFKDSIINCHAGLLPSYRGRNVLNWAIINGEKNFGITVHIINKKIDQGDILSQKKYIIKKNDDYGTILKKSFIECPKILYDTIKKIQSKKITKIPQEKLKRKSSFFRKRVQGDEYLKLNQKSHLMHNFIKGLVNPGPYARIKTKNNEIKIIKSSIINKINKNYRYKVICKIMNNKFYLNTIDRKMLCIEKWSARDKFHPRLGVKFL